MHKQQADLLYQDIFEEVYRSTMDATAEVRSRPYTSIHAESVRYFGTMAGLMKVVAEVIAGRVIEAPGCEQAIIADAIAAFREFVAEARADGPADIRDSEALGG